MILSSQNHELDQPKEYEVTDENALSFSSSNRGVYLCYVKGLFDQGVAIKSGVATSKRKSEKTTGANS